MAELVEDTWSIVTTALYKKGLARPPIAQRREFGGGLVETVTVSAGEYRLSCTYEMRDRDRVRESAEFEVKVDWEPTPFGGVRPYLWCPRCQRRRVTRLFFDPPELVCRKCAGLLYRSQTLPLDQRQLERARAIRERLGGNTWPQARFGLGPPGMHWSTYEKLKQEALALENAAIPAAVERLQGTRPRRPRAAKAAEPEPAVDVGASLRDALSQLLDS